MLRSPTAQRGPTVHCGGGSAPHLHPRCSRAVPCLRDQVPVGLGHGGGTRARCLGAAPGFPGPPSLMQLDPRVTRNSRRQDTAPRTHKLGVVRGSLQGELPRCIPVDHCAKELLPYGGGIHHGANRLRGSRSCAPGDRIAIQTAHPLHNLTSPPRRRCGRPRRLGPASRALRRQQVESLWQDRTAHRRSGAGEMDGLEAGGWSAGASRPTGSGVLARLPYRSRGSYARRSRAAASPSAIHGAALPNPGSACYHSVRRPVSASQRTNTQRWAVVRLRL
jgi:hypothetical protein